ncbi:MAG: FAD binding domain-containing protein [Rhodobacteraceae bacterium]|nr:FAD binding domain-containing protein [Paracoccaceae bacterium]
MIKVDTYRAVAEAEASMDGQSRYMGGGTLVMRDLNYGSYGFERLVRCTDPRLNSVRRDRGRIVIGAGLTMAECAENRDLAFLAAPAMGVGGPAVRNMATVGGNLFAPPPFGDFATAMLALDARVRTAGGEELGIEALLASRRTFRRIVTEIEFLPPPRGGFRFRKVSRVKPKGVSVLSICALLPQSGGRIRGARIAFNGMGATPLRATGSEAALEGRPLDRNGIAPALDAALQGLSPADDELATSWYRRTVAPVYLRRMLLERSHAY